MPTIKKTKCQCGNDYVDFENHIGCCPKCELTTEAIEMAEIRQAVLKQYTYLETSVAFESVLSILVNEIYKHKPVATRLSCEESHALDPKPVPVKKTFWQRLLRR